MKPRKIYIIGPKGSGKSTLGRIISKKLKLKYYNLEDVAWSKRDNKKRSPLTRLKNLRIIVRKKTWVIEGIFGSWTEPIFKNSDLVIILNLDYPSLIKNLLKKSIISKITGYEKEKTDIKGTIKAIKHVKKYRAGNHPKNYRGYRKLINKYKCNTIEIQTQEQLNDFIKELG